MSVPKAQEKQKSDTASTTNPSTRAVRLTLISLALGLSVEVLFYRHLLSVSILIWAALSVAALILAATLDGVKPAKVGLVLVVPILFLATMSFQREEPLTAFLNVVLMLGLFAIWVRSFRSGDWLRYDWLDLGLALIWVPIESWIRPWGILGEVQRGMTRDQEARGKLLAILRGLLLALPVVVVFAALLGAADLVFADYVDRALQWVDMERLAEFSGRTILVIISGLFTLGALVIALRDSEGRRLLKPIEEYLKPFLGAVETGIVLGAVDLLFAGFVIIQFTYLFGGQANVNEAGYTYAEYARRGFGELMAVAFLSLALIYALSTWSSRESRRQRTWFNALSSLLVLMVGVILASALSRLLAYEAAYGFTRLRTYTHISIVWMALLFTAFLILLLSGHLNRFAIAALIAALGFGISLNLLNVDNFIVRKNAARFATTKQLDVYYLGSLSDDAIPALTELALEVPQETRFELMAHLSCLVAQRSDREGERPWQSFHASRARAERALAAIEKDLAAYPVEMRSDDPDHPEWASMVVVGPGGEHWCDLDSD